MSIHNISNTIDQALTRAGLDTGSGSAKAVVETIRKALQAAHIAQHPPAEHAQAANDDNTIDVDARVVGEEVQLEPTPAERPTAASSGQFLRFEYSSASGSRAYKLYVPASYRAEPVPLVVMLHGCRQDSDDFAAGTRINQLAEEQGFLVAYPAQSPRANGSKCWHWFEPRDQTRHGGEPSIIAGIVGEIGETYPIDERRVFVAGLSAGAAMAVILGETHPDVFAAVGAHSGLPFGAAHDVASAFAAMHGGSPASAGLRAPANGPSGHVPAVSRGLPTIVFHGDRDATVALKNGSAIAEQALSKLAPDTGPLARDVQDHTAQGRRCTRTAHVDRDGLPWVEHWTVHGGGHAWSGGSAAGSFAEPLGPDASREMMRFFLLHERREAAALETAAT
jgi:poly(hydroxyalkanoate) depolymerase family esterase